MGELVIQPLDEAPELARLFWGFRDVWPEFIAHDPLGDLYYSTVERDRPEHALVAYDPDEPDIPVARALTVPVAFGGDGRTALPDDGWDGVIRWAALDQAAGRQPTLVSALEIAIRPERRGKGLSAVLLDAMRDNARRLGFSELVAPVRPTGKFNEPHTPMDDYAFRTRDDGLPADPWLRVHIRAGGEIVRVCPRAMTISGSLAEWREWTGLAFDRSGDIDVAGALVPVHCSVEHDHAVYVEPGVWVRHRL